jgi:hypothetical protein
MAALLRATTHGAVELALTGHLAADGKGKSEAQTISSPICPDWS